MAFAETANLAVKLTLGGNFTSQMAKARAQLRGLDKDASRGYKAGAQIGTGIKRGAIIAAGAATLFAGAIAKSIGAAGDFEAQLNTINTIAFKNADGLKAIGDGIRKIAKDTGLGLNDLTSSYYDLLSAGVKVTDAQAVLNDAVTLGIGGLATTNEAVDLLTTAYNAYGLNAAGAAKATDMFAQAVADGKVKASEIAATFANVASIAKAYHIGIDQIAASYGFLTAQGVPAAEVTTEMNRAIISLIKPSKALAAAQSKLGVNFTDIVKKKGLVPALEVLRKYSDKTGIPLIELLGRIEAVKYTLQTTGPNAKGFAAELDNIRKSSGEAAKQMAERQQGLNFQLAVLKANLHDAGLTIGEALLPKLTPAVAAVTQLLKDNQPAIAAFGQTLADSFTTTGVVDGIKALADGFGQMVGLAKAAAGPVKAIVNAFLSLPKEVQGVLVGAFAVNKLTGGLVTNAAGGLVEAIGKAFLGGVKAPLVNVQGAVVNVNGGIPGVPGGKPTDLVGDAAKVAGAGGAATAIGAGAALIVAPASIAALGLAIHYATDPTGAKILQGKAATASARGIPDSNNKPLQQLNQLIGATDASREAIRSAVTQNTAAQQAGLVDVKGQITAAGIKQAVATAAGAFSQAVATYGAASQVVSAVHAIPAPITNVKVDVHVTPAQVTKTIVIQKRYGPSNGSAGRDYGSGLGPGGK